MAPLSLKIVLDEGAVTRKVKFDSACRVKEAHRIIKEKVIVSDPTKEYALFLRSADNILAGIWLEEHRTLDYYMLRDGDSLDYICRIRTLKVKLLDGTVKTLQVDEAKTVSELMADICGKIGIMNYEEYGLCPEKVNKPEDKKGKQQLSDRDVTFENLSKTLHTDDNEVWLDLHRTLREQGLETNAIVILKRRLFYSDRKVDSRDPMQLNLLYVQTRDAILTGHHLVTEEQAVDCKERWINIRDVYRRILRKKLGNASRSVKTYKYENELSFMKAYYRDVSAVNFSEEEKSDEWKVSRVDLDIAGDSCSDDSNKPIKKVKAKRKKVKKRNEVLYKKEDKNPISIPNSTQQNNGGDLDVEDSIDAFLLSVGSTLKTFSPYHLNMAKTKIFAVVQDHELQQIVEREGQQQIDVKASTSDETYML